MFKDSQVELRSIGIKSLRLNKSIEEIGAEEFTALLTFTDKASYLAWVDAWKADYADLSGAIRSEKAVCRQSQRDEAQGWEDSATLQAKLRRMGVVARVALRLRHVAKAVSWDMRNAAQLRAAGAAVSASL